MNSLVYECLSLGYAFPERQWRRPDDTVVISALTHNDIRHHSRNNRIVAWCPTREAARAAHRLLTGACEP